MSVRVEDVREDYEDVVSCLSWYRLHPRYDEVDRMLRARFREDLIEARKLARGARQR